MSGRHVGQRLAAGGLGLVVAGAFLVHRRGGDALGGRSGLAPVPRAVLDVLVLAFALGAPGPLRHDPSSVDDPMVDASARRAVQQRREQQRREEDAYRLVSPQQSDRDPDEADLRRLDIEPAKAILVAEHVHDPGEPCKAAGDRHRDDVVPRDADAAVPRRLRVEPDGANLIPQCRPIQGEPEGDECSYRNEEADVQSL